MKILFLFVVFVLLSKSLFAYDRADTTFVYDLNGDDKKETIKLTANEEEGTMVLEVNKSKFTYMPSSAAYTEVKVVWIKDKAYLLVSNVDYYGFESSLFSFDKKIDSIGSIWSLDKPEITNSGILKVNNWMGFWSADYEYHLINNKLEAKYKDEYNLSEHLKENVIKTTEKIYLHSGKMVNSKGLYEIKPNTQIFIQKADIREKCKGEDEWQESCYWYFIRSKDGTEGWIMLKEFQDKVEGIPWAG
ncbi:MAG: hypothetical protein WCK13_07795 [Ignavibacteriota bacterium]|nr:hypothetical protein [Ignavibacteriota bacterium]